MEKLLNRPFNFSIDDEQDDISFSKNRNIIDIINDNISDDEKLTLNIAVSFKNKFNCNIPLGFVLQEDKAYPTGYTLAASKKTNSNIFSKFEDWMVNNKWNLYKLKSLDVFHNITKKKFTNEQLLLFNNNDILAYSEIIRNYVFHLYILQYKLDDINVEEIPAYLKDYSSTYHSELWNTIFTQYAKDLYEIILNDAIYKLILDQLLNDDYFVLYYDKNILTSNFYILDIAYSDDFGFGYVKLLIYSYPARTVHCAKVFLTGKKLYSQIKPLNKRNNLEINKALKLVEINVNSFPESLLQSYNLKDLFLTYIVRFPYRITIINRRSTKLYPLSILQILRKIDKKIEKNLLTNLKYILLPDFFKIKFELLRLKIFNFRNNTELKLTIYMSNDNINLTVWIIHTDEKYGDNLTPHIKSLEYLKDSYNEHKTGYLGFVYDNEKLEN